MATATVSSPTNVTFKRIKGVDLPGSSLWFELPGVTCEQIRRLFGTGLATQKKEKYSSRIVIESSVTGKRYTLYMCFGDWRVGALSRDMVQHSIDELALSELFG